MFYLRAHGSYFMSQSFGTQQRLAMDSQPGAGVILRHICKQASKWSNHARSKESLSQLRSATQHPMVIFQEELNMLRAYSQSWRQICTGVEWCCNTPSHTYFLDITFLKKKTDFVWMGAGQHNTCQVLKANLSLQASNIVWRLCPPCSSACSPGITWAGGSSTSAYTRKYSWYTFVYLHYICTHAYIYACCVCVYVCI